MSLEQNGQGSELIPCRSPTEVVERPFCGLAPPNKPAGSRGFRSISISPKETRNFDTTVN